MIHYSSNNQPLSQMVCRLQNGGEKRSSRVMYRIACPACGEDYEATTASWCRCLNKDRSLVCPSCRRCFCDATSTTRNQLWRDAPEELWTARLQGRDADPLLPVLKKPLVLVVDDDPGIRALALELITRFGHGCIAASNATSALRLAHRYHPDLVLTDLLMPGMDGRELSQALKTNEEIPPPRVIVMTSVYRGEDYEKEARTAYGVDAYLEKPVPMETLRALLADLLPDPEQSHAVLSPSSGEVSVESLDELDDDIVIVG